MDQQQIEANNVSDQCVQRCLVFHNDRCYDQAPIQHGGLRHLSQYSCGQGHYDNAPQLSWLTCLKVSLCYGLSSDLLLLARKE